MIHLVNFCRSSMGAAGTAVSSAIFLALTVLGVVIAIRGRSTMIWLVSVCAFVCGALTGAIIGILAFDSIILMIVLASVCSVLLAVLVRHFKAIGHFLSIGCLGWFLAFVLTSEMNIAGDTMSENTLLFIDLVVGIVMGFMAACRSKFTASFVTAAAGGVIASISALALIGFYFADFKTWILAILIAASGFAVQIHTYDIKPPKPKKKKRK